jgi:hypothetical protein
MTAPKSHALPHLLLSAAELLVHRARLRLQMRLGESVNEALPLDTLEHRLAGPEGRAWERLVELFGLSEPEADLLALALAVAAEPALGPLVARAQEAEGRLLPTEPLIKLMHGHPARPIWRPTSPLSMWRLVTPVRLTPGESPGYEADRQLVDWMFGHLSLDAELVLALDACPAGPTPAEWPVGKTAERLDHALQQGVELRLVVQGRGGAGRRNFAAAVAQKLGREALVADADVIPQTDWAEAFMLAQRFALFADAALIWRAGSPAWPAKIPMAPLQFVCAAPGETAPCRDGASDLTIALPEPGIDSKSALFAALVPRLAGDAQKLAATPGLLLGDLQEVGRTAPRSVDEAADDLRARARARMRGAGHVVDPVFGWDDMIAPETLLTQLKRITFEARTRPQLMEHPETARLYQHAAGLSALFSGPPGVGKSMAAHVIARDLGSNLLVVDLASTTSKFIGETAKNLSKAFAQAKASGAALIFEEADAFFAKRTDVRDSNDRYANTDTNHLLQLLEAHDGLVILSTNRRANIDPAFIRRLRHVVEFPKPGPVERRDLWRRMLEGLGKDPAPLTEAIDRLAITHDLSPAQIKGAALSALYSALHGGRAISPADLTAATEQELTKEGRAAPAATTKPRRQRNPQNG